MSKIKTYKLFQESISDDISDFIQDLHLKDNDIKCTFQFQNNDEKLIIYLVSNNFRPNDMFRIGDVEYEALSLINFLQSLNFNLFNVKYRIAGKYRSNIWKILFDTKPNRWGVKSDPKYIFDVQTDGFNFKDTIIDSFEMIFTKNG